MGRIWKVLTRKKAINPVTAEETRLSRVLNVFDLTALGVGSTLGVGVYVLAGQVAKTTAGPSVILSFLIAAIASVFAGLCYAEFGARAPRAGSAYIYSYVCVGEFIAFVIGWNLILEYVIGSASVARGLSLYLDTLINNTLQDTFREIAPINVEYLASYFDFFSFGISILLAIGLAFGLKESSMANNIITCLNILVVLFIIIAGSLKADIANWRISPNNTNVTNSTTVGNGGFFPFGVEGMIKGAATCFYGFVGFDCIATTDEEVKNPRRAIPVSIVVSLFIIFLAYFGVATVLTLMVPYYLQDYNAPIPRAFEMMGWEAAKWIVAIGALFGLFASLFGAMFPLPRIIYAMGSDGLVFKFLAKVHPKFQTPVVGTILAGFLTGLMAALFDLSQLINMMSIGTLQAYTIVAASVLLLRYNDDTIRQNFDGPTTSDEQELISNDSTSFGRSLKYIINCSIKEPSKVTENIVTFNVLLYCVLCIGICLCVIYLQTNITNGEIWAIIISSIIVGLTILVLLSLYTQPKSKKELSFKVPCVPLIPALSILVNIYLMLMLDYRTWVRFAVWMAVGIPMYCMLACTEKAPLKPQNRCTNATNITNGHTKMLNGISNPTFVNTETNGQEMRQKTTKKKAAPLPPTIFEQTENIEVQQAAVIADLEEILEKEEAISQLDDVLNNRKFSAGSLSNLSAVASYSEDVVADVHCANVVSPVAVPDSLPFPTHSETASNLGTGQINSESVEVSGDMNDDDKILLYHSSANDSLVKSDTPPNLSSELVEVCGDTNANEQIWPSNSSSDDKIVESESAETIEKTSVELPDENILIKKEEEISPKLEDSNNEQTNSAPIDEDTEAFLIKPIVSSVQDLENILPDNQENIKSVEKSKSPSVVFSPVVFTKELNDEPVVSSPVPSELALKTVTLRHVKKQIKQIEPTDNQNASNDNLKVGSKEYKNFIKKLDDKLKRNTVLPTIYVAPRKGGIVKPQPVVPNENVIEDHIDQVGAKEKLKVFYAKRNNTEEAKSPMTENSKPILLGSKSVDETLLSINDRNNATSTLENTDLQPGTQGSKDISENSKNPNSELQDHKSKMEDVFNSIKLKSLEKQGDEHLKRRLSQSLGSSFSKEDGRTEHKHKMDDIFKDIKTLGKDS